MKHVRRLLRDYPGVSAIVLATLVATPGWLLTFLDRGGSTALDSAQHTFLTSAIAFVGLAVVSPGLLLLPLLGVKAPLVNHAAAAAALSQVLYGVVLWLLLESQRRLAVANNRRRTNYTK